MNESLAKQLHKLINNSMWSIKLGIDDILSEEMDNLEDDVNKLIERNNTQEKPNEQ
jgi:hypothetical protein